MPEEHYLQSSQHAQDIRDRNRLPTLFEVLNLRTLAPVDLYSFYIFMKEQYRGIEYLDFWLDVVRHLSLCRNYVRGLRQSLLASERDMTSSRTSSVLLDNLIQDGTLDDTDSHRLSAFLRGTEPGGSQGGRISALLDMMNPKDRTQAPLGEYQQQQQLEEDIQRHQQQNALSSPTQQPTSDLAAMWAQEKRRPSGTPIRVVMQDSPEMAVRQSFNRSSSVYDEKSPSTNTLPNQQLLSYQTQQHPYQTDINHSTNSFYTNAPPNNNSSIPAIIPTDTTTSQQRDTTTTSALYNQGLSASPLQEQQYNDQLMSSQIDHDPNNPQTVHNIGNNNNNTAKSALAGHPPQQHDSQSASFVTRNDIRQSTHYILVTYFIPGAEREIVLPQRIMRSVRHAIEQEQRDDPEVFDEAREYVFQAMQRESFRAFLAAKALGNTTPFGSIIRLIIGLMGIFAGFWVGFILIFLDWQPKSTRLWLILPFAFASYGIVSGLYNLDPILAILGFSERGPGKLIKIKEPYVRRLLIKRSLFVLGIIILIAAILVIIFALVPGKRL